MKTIGDAHCHLTDLPDPESAIAEARAAGVGPILAVTMAPDDGARALELAARHPGAVLAGVGLHPSRVPEIDDARAAEELALAEERAPRAAFVGEIGLDYKDAPGREEQRRQREILERLLDLAGRLRKPVNLHTRRADRDLLQAATEFTRRTGLPANLHWFTHSRKLARRCGEAGLFISAGPSILHDPRQAAVAAAIDPGFLLVETDSPVRYAGEAARPAWASRVLARLAEVRGVPVAALRSRLAANLGRFLQQGS